MSEVREQIRKLLERGLSLNEIAQRIGVAGPTVSYHVARLQARSVPEADPEPMCSVKPSRTKIRTRDLVAGLLADGLGRNEIAQRLGLSKSTVSYHARRLDQPIDSRCARRYDWQAIQDYYDRGHSMRQCRARFGFSTHSWHEAVKRGALVPRPAAIPRDQYFAAGVYRNRYRLKLRLLKEGLKESRCEHCGLTEWLGSPLPMALHHVNGDRNDHRLENLRLLCPNCHSQTPNFSGRNARRRVHVVVDEAA